jgi:hypothetical protein
MHRASRTATDRACLGRSGVDLNAAISDYQAVRADGRAASETSLSDLVLNEKRFDQSKTA